MKTVIKSFKWQPHLGYKLPIEVISTDELRKSGKALPKAMGQHHRVDFLSFIMVISGRNQHVLDFETFTLQEGMCLVTHPKVTQRFDLNAEWQGYLIAIKPEFFQPTTQPKQDQQQLTQWVQNLPILFSLNPEQMSYCIALIDQLYQASQQPVGNLEHYKAWVFHQSATLLAYLVLIASPQENSHKTDSPLTHKARLFQQLLEQHFVQQREVAWYAEQLHCTAKTLTRATTHYYGNSPKQLLLKRLVLESKRLLVHTTQSSSEIAQQLLFEDLSNFTKFFKRETGLTPLGFREREKFNG